MIAPREVPKGRVARKAVWLGVGLAIVALTVAPTWSAGQSMGKPQIIFTIEQSTSHLGGGAALSPDGTTLVYVAAGGPHSGLPNRLYAASVGTGAKRPVLNDKDAGTGGGVFSSPSFSPDGTQIVFSASGGTYYYASDIYSVHLDSSGLTRLTHSKEINPEHRPPDIGQAEFWQYFGWPQFAPDGSKILLGIDNTVGGSKNVAVMNTDGSGLKVVAQGEPLFWGSDSQSVFYDPQARGTPIQKLDLASDTSEGIQGLPQGLIDPDGVMPSILGKLPDKEWFVLAAPKTHNVSLVSVQHGAATFQTSLDIPLSKATAKGPVSLVSVQWAPIGKVLLIYQGDKVERFEVGQLAK